MKIKSVIVLGLGKVGSLVGTLLHKTGFEVTGVSIHAKDDLPFPVITTDMAQIKRFTGKFRKFDAMISCLPYKYNLEVATAAHKHGVHLMGNGGVRFPGQLRHLPAP